ncbi:MAG TPA: glycoside hydrolase family 38 C-terminal domain-containing protein, partial [Thermoanaerobaculia bacterium]|nr:glycoside hydrolase family 38 C-terminal domain-containing protein [Thermoanaerobaculia bacterium]
RLLWHQFHDDLTGTSIPQAYAISWHDEALVANLAATALRRAMGAVAQALDTRAEGIPLVVFNPLSIPRTEVVEGWLELPAAVAAIAATGPEGEPVPVQLGVTRGTLRQVLLLAELPPLGFAVFDVHQGRPGAGASGALEVTRAALSNGRLAARFDGAGDLASLVDSRHGREALAAPHRLELLPDTSKRFPAWELRYQDVMAEPLPVAGPSRVTVVEHGPVRVAVEVVRTAAGSTFRQRYRLAAGAAGDRLEVAARVDWRSRGRLLKASFPFAAAAEEAVYDLGVCAIRRGTNRPRLYEVPAQQWAAVEAPDAAWGAAVLATTNQGWDLPAPGRLRLSLVRTPRVGRRFRHQGWQDLGRHHLLWALAPFAGGWWQDRVPWLAARLNQPPLAVATTAHPGALGRRWSFLEVDDERLMVRAVKGAEDGAGVVVRGVELSGEGAAATLRAAAPVRRSQRVDGVEDPLAEIHPLDGAVPLQTPAHRPLAVLLELAPPPAALALAPPRWRALPLSGDRRVATRRGEPCRDGIGRRRALPAELLPQQLDWLGIGFQLGETPRALACRGQSLPLADDAAAASNEAWTHLFLLAGSAGGELRLELRVDATTHAVSLPAVTGPLGQWDRLRRIGWGRFSWRRRIPGFFTRADVGLAVDHLHDRRGHLLPYAQAQLFVVTLPLPSGARALHLPTAPAALLFAATLAADPAASVREAFHLSTPGPGGATARRGSRW